MKKFILGIVFGIILTGSIAGVVAYNYSAKNIEYNPKDTSWNVNNVEDAIKDLKIAKGGEKPVLLWTNSSPTSGFAAQTISLDLTNYKYVIVVTNDSVSNYETNRSNGIVPIGDYKAIGIGRIGGSATLRHFKATTSGVIVGATQYGSSGDGNNFVIPYKIYGLTDELDIDIK